MSDLGRRVTMEVVSAALSRVARIGLVIACISVTPLVIAAPASSEATSRSYEEGWWRHIRQGTWTWQGADWAVVEQTLTRISEAEGERRIDNKYDTIIEYGPGHWVYEWSAIAEEAYKNGQEHEDNGNRVAALQSFARSSIYYTQASYPHTKEKYSRKALKQAFASYRKAGEFFPIPLEVWEFEVDGVRFDAFVHLPAGTEGPVPVLLKTSGMDVLSTEFYPLAETLADAGVALVTFDSPGTGNDGVVDENYERHHMAVLERVWADERFSQDRIGVWSDSLAGGLPVKIAVGEHGDKIAAAINGCGVIHAAFNMDLLGPTTIDKRKLAYAYKNGLLTSEQLEEFERASSSPTSQALMQHFQSQVLVERLGADPSNLLDVLAKSVPVSLVNQGVLGGKNITTTPILVVNTHSDPLVPYEESLLAADASVQGKLMIIDDYGGHCVSREEYPLILEWLSYHLQVDALGGFVELNKVDR